MTCSKAKGGVRLDEPQGDAVQNRRDGTEQHHASDPRPRCTEFFDLVSDTNTHAARTRTGTHEASQDRLL
jgi:hypothetical protein